MVTVSRVVKYLVVSLLLAGLIWFWFDAARAEAEPQPRPAPPVITVYPEQTDLHRSITLGGYIESESTVTVLPRVSGMLDQLLVEAGDAVTEGEVIARIDADTLQLQKMQAEAAYRTAKSAYERTARLYESGTATISEYDQASSHYEAQKSQYDIAQLQLRYADIVSPMDGTVLVRHTSRGSLVSPEVPIVTVGTIDELKITSRIPERYYELFTEMQDEMTVHISRPVSAQRSGANPYEASITRISPHITAETMKFEVVSKITDAPGILRPGMFVNVTYVLERRRDVFSLPQKAFVPGGYVWYVDEDSGTARRMELEDPFETETRFTVPEAYRDVPFILEGQHFLEEGQKIRITGTREQ